MYAGWEFESPWAHREPAGTAGFASREPSSIANDGHSQRDRAYLVAIAGFAAETCALDKGYDVERVRLHAALTILAKLSCALSRARALPLAT